MTTATDTSLAHDNTTNAPEIKFKDRKAFLRAVSPNPSDAQEAWASFRTAQRTKQGSLVTDDGKGAAGDNARDEKDFKQKASVVSTVMAAAKVAQVHGFSFAQVLDDARSIITSEKTIGNSKHNTWDGFAAVARVQKGVNTPLTADDIRKSLMPKEAEEKEATEAKSLGAIIKALEKHINGTQETEDHAGKPGFPSAEAERALDMLKERHAEVELLTLKTGKGKK